MWWLLLWLMTGLLGGGWWRYSVYRHFGNADHAGSRPRTFVVWALMGPIAIAFNAYASKTIAGRFYWGLRFR